MIAMHESGRRLEADARRDAEDRARGRERSIVLSSLPRAEQARIRREMARRQKEKDKRRRARAKALEKASSG